MAKGPFIRGSSVDVSTLDEGGAATGEVYGTSTTDDAGSFALDLTLLGPVRLEADGYYYNEVTGALSGAPITLRALHVFEEGGAAQVHINLFTHLAQERADGLISDGSSVAEAVAEAEGEAATALQVAPAGFDPGAAGGDMDLLGGDETANAWLFALSVTLCQYAVNLAGVDGPIDATLSEVVNGVALDLSDGTLEGGARVPTGDQLYALQATIDADAVMALLATRFAEIGSTAEVPDLHRVFDLDLDGLVDLDDADADGDGVDGVVAGGLDCDDYDPEVYPGAADDPSDGVDADCAADGDGDGYLATESGGDDCDDTSDATHPGATETPYDGIDNDCDAATSDDDADADGAPVASDCDDADPTAYPGAEEICDDGLDQDCDGSIDERCPVTIRDTLLIVDASTSLADIEAAALACGVAAVASGVPPRDADLGITDEDLPVLRYEDVTTYWVCPDGAECYEAESRTRTWEHADCAD